MTLEAQTPRGIHTGSGTTGPFTLQDDDGVQIQVDSASHVILTKYASANATSGTVLTHGVDYTLAGVPSNGVTYTLTTALTSGEFIEWKRIQPLNQNLDLDHGGDFSATNIEARFDTNEQQIQENRASIDRALKAHWKDTSAPSLPATPTEDKLLARDSTGAIVYKDTTTISDSVVLGSGWADILENAPPASLDDLGGIRVETTYSDMLDMASDELTLGGIVYVTGRASANDGGQCFYRVVGESTGSVDGGKYSDSTTTSYQFEAIFGNVVNDLHYGITGSSSGEATKIQNWLNACDGKVAVQTQDHYLESAITVTANIKLVTANYKTFFVETLANATDCMITFNGQVNADRLAYVLNNSTVPAAIAYQFVKFNAAANVSFLNVSAESQLDNLTASGSLGGPGNYGGAIQIRSEHVDINHIKTDKIHWGMLCTAGNSKFGLIEFDNFAVGLVTRSTTSDSFEGIMADAIKSYTNSTLNIVGQPPGYNTLLCEDLSNSDFGKIYIKEAIEHGIRLDGSGTEVVKNLSFGNVFIESANKSGFKVLNGTERITGINIGSLTVNDIGVGTGSINAALHLELASDVNIGSLNVGVKVSAGASARRGIYCDGVKGLNIGATQLDKCGQGVYITDTSYGPCDRINIPSAQITNSTSNCIILEHGSNDLNDISMTNLSVYDCAEGIIIDTRTTTGIAGVVNLTGVVKTTDNTPVVTKVLGVAGSVSNNRPLRQDIISGHESLIGLNVDSKTTAQLSDATNKVNTSNKWPGKAIYNITTQAYYSASSSGATDAWRSWESANTDITPS